MVLLVVHQISPAGNKLRVLGDPHDGQQAKQAQHPSLWPPVSQTCMIIIVTIIIMVTIQRYRVRFNVIISTRPNEYISSAIADMAAQSCTIQILTVVVFNAMFLSNS